MLSLIERIKICQLVREETARITNEILKKNSALSEVDFRNLTIKNLFDQRELHQSGWYDPPPFGVAALFSQAPYTRLQFDTLRSKKFWPQKENFLTKESVGIIYLSPVHRESGIIGDFGATFYYGKDEKIVRHLKKSLSLLEKVTDFIEIGMEFRKIHEFAQQLFQKNEVNNHRTTVHNDPAGTNLGHTVPWTYEDPTTEEEKIIEDGDIETLRNLISKKRIYINALEKFKIPSTIAFTFEARLEDSENSHLPNAFYHLIVCFINGKKTILKNFECIFLAR